jgi:hypothetical protein
MLWKRLGMERISKGSKRLCKAGAVPFDNWVRTDRLIIEAGKWIGDKDRASSWTWTRIHKLVV